METVAYLPRQL